MIKVKDASGNVLPGVYKDSRGSVVIKNDEAFSRYTQEMKSARALKQLQDDMIIMKEQIQLLFHSLNKLKGK